MIPELRDLNYGECLKQCVLAIIETWRLRRDHMYGVEWV